jgi:hypothetical protein
MRGSLSHSLPRRGRPSAVDRSDYTFRAFTVGELQSHWLAQRIA